MVSFRGGPDVSTVYTYYPTITPLTFSQVEDTYSQGNAMSLSFSTRTITSGAYCGENVVAGSGQFPTVTFYYNKGWMET